MPSANNESEDRLAMAGSSPQDSFSRTRGGLATVAHDIAAATGAGVRLDEEKIPVREPVAGVCEILGYDPLYLASEGRVVAVLSPDAAPVAVAALNFPAPPLSAVSTTWTDSWYYGLLSAENGFFPNLRTTPCQGYVELLPRG